MLKLPVVAASADATANPAKTTDAAAVPGQTTDAAVNPAAAGDMAAQLAAASPDQLLDAAHKMAKKAQTTYRKLRPFTRTTQAY